MISLQKTDNNVQEKQNKISKANVKFDMIAVGSSTGGVNAIRELLGALPDNLPPIVITQHMPEGYTTRFAERLNRDCAMKVVEASNHQELEKGCVYIAPGTHHMKIVKRGSKYITELSDGAIVSGHRPSVDVMFQSIAKSLDGHQCVAIMLTGMGRDGAQGMLELNELGCPTIGQNKESCVVYGMPKVAFELGAVDIELPLDKIAHHLLDVLCGTDSKAGIKRKVI
jgi:two-component system chemotaxis response regulator CheB